jgi:predicted 3-demethylubiquinone-9 3-methyltransferase (glyoxalase superfamily)
MQNISSCLWFDKNAEEAAEFYVSIFKNSKIVSKTHYQVETPSKLPAGTVLTVNFMLNGQEFTALNGGPFFKFNEAVSFIVKCKNQEEIDYYWEKLSAVPESEQCGWLKDKFGMSWQIVPENIDKLVSTKPAMKALLDMKKIVIKDLQNAA